MKKLIKLTFICAAVIFAQQAVNAQASFGTTEQDPYLQVWIESLQSDGGLLIPRLNTSERDLSLENDDPTVTKNHPCGGSNPPCVPSTNTSQIPVGLTIFNTTEQEFQWWDGVRWKKSINSGFETGTALPEVFFEDKNGSAVAQFEYTWSTTGAPTFIAGTKLLWRMTDLEDADGYSIDRRSNDLKTANLFEWDETNQKFIPDTENGTYDLVFEFDLTNNTGSEGTTITVDAWDATDITTVNADGTVVFAGGALPISSSYQIIPKGNNDTYNNYPQPLKVVMTNALFTNGLRFTITTDTETITITDFALIATRIR